MNLSGDLTLVETTEPPKVGFDLRLVPNGTIRDTKGNVTGLAATMLISPNAKDGGSDDVTLREWPSQVAKILAGPDSKWKVQIEIMGIKVPPKGQAPLVPVPARDPDKVLRGVCVKAKAAFTQKRVPELDPLWRETFQRNGEFNGESTVVVADPWGSLHTALLEQAISKALPAGPNMSKPEAADPTVPDDLGNQGQMKPKPPSGPVDATMVEAIIAAPQGALGLAMEAQRAAELCATLSDLKHSVPSLNVVKKVEVSQQVFYEQTDTPDEDQAKKALKDMRTEEFRAAITASHGLRKKSREDYIAAKASADSPTCDACADICASNPMSNADGSDNIVRDGQFVKDAQTMALCTWPEFPDEPESGEAVSMAPKIEGTPEIDLMAERFFAIQSTPSMARVFLMAIDVTITADTGTDLNAVLQDCGKYAYVRVSTSGLGPAAKDTTWTLCRLTDPKPQARFWPATYEELKAWLRTDGNDNCFPPSISQYGGVVVMSSGWCPGGNHRPRFDVSTLAIRAATDSEVQRRRMIQSISDTSGNHGPLPGSNPETPDVPWPDLAFGANHHTVGLSLLNQDALGDTVRRLARREVTCKADCFLPALDAEDLTIGFRPMVAKPYLDTKGIVSVTSWRSLVARKVQYGTSGKRNFEIVEKILADLVGIPSSVLRVEIDSAFVSSASRLMNLPTDQGNGVEAYVDEEFLTWDGGLMGLHIPGKVDRDFPKVPDTLAFGKSISPVVQAPIAFTFRYGEPYRFALLPVYSGGRSVPPDAMPDDWTPPTKETPEIVSRLYLPPGAARTQPQALDPSCLTQPRSDPVALPFVRALRHDRINSPIVLMTAAQALRINGPMGAEQGGELVVRSLRAPESGGIGAKLKSRATPRLVQRVILVPTINPDEAMRHGAFDKIKFSQPGGSWQGARLDAKTGNFPSVITRNQRGIDDKTYLVDRHLDGNAAASLIDFKDSASDAILDLQGFNRPTTLFPDPAVTAILIGLRRPGTKDYIGVPTMVEVRADMDVTSDTLPVLLTVEADTSRITGDPVITVKKSVTFGTTSSGDARWSSGLRGPSVVIQLAPGDVFDVDLWCVAGPKALARLFAIVQTLGVQLQQKGQASHICRDQDMLKGAATCLPPKVVSALQAMFAACPTGQDFAYVAPGGVLAPDNALLRSLARVIANQHCAGPIAELSAVTTLRAVHAVNRIAVKPVIVADPRPDPFAKAAIDPPAPVDGLLPLVAARRSYRGGPDAVIGALKDAGLVLSGQIGVDLQKCDAIEVIASCILPGSDRFDDPDRGRSLAMRQGGEWPTEIGGTPIAPGVLPYRKAVKIFGFKVASDGRVTLPSAEVLLLRIDGLAAAGENVELRPYFEMGLPDHDKDEPTSTDPTAPIARVTHRHIFPDGKARVLSVRVNGLSRTATAMATVNRVAGLGDLWVGTMLDAFLNNEQVPGEPLPAQEQAWHSDAVRVVMPASVRPRPPVAHTPMPVFHRPKPALATVAAKSITVERTSMIRISLGRGWFSSGEDEALGIVLWPPEFASQDAALLEDNIVKLGKTEHGYDRPHVALSGFMDEDLGPGGRFVTRRGSDPVRGGTDEHRFFLHRHDIRSADDLDLASPDLAGPGLDGCATGFVGSVAMPLDENPLADPNTGAAEGSPPMLVGLSLHIPRFDVEREEWYVDLALRPGPAPESFVRLGLVRYQPHTIPALRASTPVVQWVQPLPARRATVAWRDDGGLTVTVEGPAALKRKTGDTGGGPFMRLALFVEGRDIDDRPTHRFCPLEPAMGDAAPKLTRWVAGTLGKAGVIWTTILDAAILQNVTRDARLLIEEIEVYRPASYPDEPVAPVPDASDLRRRATGPRFAEVIDLEPLMLSQAVKMTIK